VAAIIAVPLFRLRDAYFSTRRCHFKFDDTAGGELASLGAQAMHFLEARYCAVILVLPCSTWQGRNN